MASLDIGFKYYKWLRDALLYFLTVNWKLFYLYTWQILDSHWLRAVTCSGGNPLTTLHSRDPAKWDYQAISKSQYFPNLDENILTPS